MEPYINPKPAAPARSVCINRNVSEGSPDTRSNKISDRSEALPWPACWSQRKDSCVAVRDEPRYF